MCELIALQFPKLALVQYDEDYRGVEVTGAYYFPLSLLCFLSPFVLSDVLVLSPEQQNRWSRRSVCCTFLII